MTSERFTVRFIVDDDGWIQMSLKRLFPANPASPADGGCRCGTGGSGSGRGGRLEGRFLLRFYLILRSEARLCPESQVPAKSGTWDRKE